MVPLQTLQWRPRPLLKGGDQATSCSSLAKLSVTLTGFPMLSSPFFIARRIRVRRPALSDSAEIKEQLLAALCESRSGEAENPRLAGKINDFIGKLTDGTCGHHFSEDLIKGDWALVFTRNAKGAPALQKISRTRAGNTFANFRKPGTFENVVSFLGGRGRLSATVTYAMDPKRSERISCDITAADLQLGWLRIPLPLRAKGGWLDFLYLDDDVRITIGNRGGLFVHIRPEKVVEYFHD